MRFTIERMRTLVLAAAALLLLALVAALAIHKLKHPFNGRDIPKKLGLNIVQEAGGYTFSHALGGHSQYKIHASRLVQLKDNRAMLHDVKIELFDNDGQRVDRIEGGEFEYDQNKGTVRAEGPVEITLLRPAATPAIAPKAVAGKSKETPLTAAEQSAAAGEVKVKTSGLSFDRESGLATTDRRVDFSMAQGWGSSMGASYDSGNGVLVLFHAVELHTWRGEQPVELHAQHAEFARDEKTCRLRAASLQMRDEEAAASDAVVLFRADGSAEKLNAANGFTLTTQSGSRIAAPTAQLEFNAHNQPLRGHLEGGVLLDSASQLEHSSRQLHGAAPTAHLEFNAQGNLHSAHLERGVELHSEEHSENAKDGPVHLSRTWRSPLADLVFRDAPGGRLALESIHGTGGAVVTSESQRGKAPAEPSRMAADDLTGQFSVGSVLNLLVGLGHASFEETAANGAHQSTSGDRLEAHFLAAPGKPAPHPSNDAAATQIQSAIVEGHVVLTQQPAVKAGTQPKPPLHATAGRALYEGAGSLLHLTLSPRMENGGLQLSADKIDVAQEAGDAFAHGNVKATWTGDHAANQAAPAPALGGQGPAHAVAAEAQLHQASGEATFRGEARVWQDANSVAAPVIVLDRTRQTLTAHASNAADPVKVVLLSASGAASMGDPSKEAKASTPSVIRLRGGDLRYSEIERKALMRGGALKNVTAETGTATSVSDEVELQLMPAGKRSGQQAAQVDRMTARGHVTLLSEGRRGTGEQLVYSGQTGEYVLTGTAAAPPRITDAARGAVTGEAVLYHSRSGSVTVEGGSGKTTTETRTPK